MKKRNLELRVEEVIKQKRREETAEGVTPKQQNYDLRRLDTICSTLPASFCAGNHS